LEKNKVVVNERLTAACFLAYRWVFCTLLRDFPTDNNFLLTLIIVVPFNLSRGDFGWKRTGRGWSSFTDCGSYDKSADCAERVAVAAKGRELITRRDPGNLPQTQT